MPPARTVPARGRSFERLRTEAEKKDIRRLLHGLAEAIKLGWTAGRRHFVAAAVLQIFSGLSAGVQLFVMRSVLASILSAERVGQGMGSVATPLLVLLAVRTGTSFISLALAEQQRLLSELTARHVTRKIMDVTESVELEAFETPTFFDHLQRAQSGGAGRTNAVVTALLGLMSTVFGIVGVAAALLSMQPLVIPLVLLARLPTTWATTRNSRMFYEFSFEMTTADRERNYLSRLLMGRDQAKEVRAFNLARFLRERWERLTSERLVKLRRVIRRRLQRSALASLVSSAITAMTYALLVYMLLSGRMPIASAATAAIAVQQLAGRIAGVGGRANRLYEASLFLDDFSAFVELKPVIDDQRPKGRAPKAFRRITVDEVGFVYPGSNVPAVRDVSFEINAGEVVALVGENGSGKTTLAKILCNLHMPTSGRVLWDDVDLATCEPDGVRDQIAVIFQDFVRYQLTARENVGMGRYEASHDLDAVRAAAAQAGADAFLAPLPLGYDTPLGRLFDGGQDLSIGQWQRVSMARAFMRDAPFIVLDEPTAALDPRAEADLFARIRTLCAGRTVLLISHRFSSVRSADRILVLDRGRLVENGTHDDLMAAGGQYAELFTLQADAYLNGNGPGLMPRADRIRLARSLRGGGRPGRGHAEVAPPGSRG